jgi:hypothetical protein
MPTTFAAFGQKQNTTPSNPSRQLDTKQGGVGDQDSVERREHLAYPIMEINRTDQTRQQALHVIHHTERKQANRLHLISPSLENPLSSTPAADYVHLLTHIQELEKKLAALQAKENGTANQISSAQLSQPQLSINETSIERFENLETPELPLPNQWVVEIKRYKKLNYRYGSAQLYNDSESIEAIRARESSSRGGGYVLNVYREYDWEGNALNSKLEICSTPLLELIRDLIDYYPGPEFDLLRWEDTVGDTVTFSEPYMMLFTHRSQMNDSLLDEDIPEETKNHVRLLLQFLREELPRTSAKLDEIEAGKCKKITFQDLWLLYVPNTPVFIAVNNEDRQMVVYSRNVPEKNVKGQWGVLSLYCWSAKYQGNHLTRDFYPWVIQPFTGEKAIRHLDLVPMQYLPDQAAVRERLTSRGNRYFELNQGAVLQDYHGNQFPRIFKDVSWIFSHGGCLVPGLTTSHSNRYESLSIKTRTGENAESTRRETTIHQKNTDFPRAKIRLKTKMVGRWKGPWSAVTRKSVYSRFVTRIGVRMTPEYSDHPSNSKDQHLSASMT